MTTRTPDEIDFSTFPDSDGEPMAETLANRIQMTGLIFALERLLPARGHTRAIVSGNQFVYYNPLNGRENISPDVYVVFDVPPPAPPSWKTWLQGKFPDIVFEITSESTWEHDVSDAPTGKRSLYAQLGAREYYIYDPQQEMAPPFLGYELRAGRFEPLPFLPSGGIMSPLLGAELRPIVMEEMEQRPAGTWLRVIDPATGRPILIPDELEGRFVAAEQARLLAEQRAAQAEAALQAALAALRAQGQDSASSEP